MISLQKIWDGNTYLPHFFPTFNLEKYHDYEISVYNPTYLYIRNKYLFRSSVYFNHNLL